mmetsp:Transcript_13350/g.1199  ORF Transcript_13350/g.1199 Transcript_13350/m.1199 type:complete len:84 (-) Transcript_13350:378-629(-)
MRIIGFLNSFINTFELYNYSYRSKYFFFYNSHIICTISKYYRFYIIPFLIFRRYFPYNISPFFNTSLNISSYFIILYLINYRA